MEKEAARGRATAPVRNMQQPPKHILCHLKCLWVGNQEENEG